MSLPRLFVFIFWSVIFVTALPLQAREAKNPYEVHDVLTGKKFTEYWDVVTESPGVRNTTKTSQVNTKIVTSEKSIGTPFWWLRETKTGDDKQYYEEFLSEPPYGMSPEATAHGYMNVRDMATGEISESWPMFVSVQLFQGVRKITFKLYISNNRITEVTRVYHPQNYFYPYVEEWKVYKPGIMPENVPLTGVRSYFFETYVITSRKLE